MFIITKLQEALSIYVVLTILVIGLYMGFRQSKALSTVSHLDREAKFTKIVGYIYIGVAIAAAILLLLG